MNVLWVCACTWIILSHGVTWFLSITVRKIWLLTPCPLPFECYIYFSFFFFVQWGGKNSWQSADKSRASLKTCFNPNPEPAVFVSVESRQTSDGTQVLSLPVPEKKRDIPFDRCHDIFQLMSWLVKEASANQILCKFCTLLVQKKKKTVWISAYNRGGEFWKFFFQE